MTATDEAVQEAAAVQVVLDFLKTRVPHTGPHGFEGLIADVLSAETGRSFRIALSGPQSGLDLEAEPNGLTSIAVEAKHYFSGRPSLRELMAELSEVILLNPPVEVWILATTTSIPPNYRRTIDEFVDRHGLIWVCLDTDLSGPRLLWLMAAQAQAVEAFARRRDPKTDLGALMQALSYIASSSKLSGNLSSLRMLLGSAQLGFAHAAARMRHLVLKTVEDRTDSFERFHQNVAVRLPGDTVVERHGISNALDRWLREDAPSGRHAALIGDEGTGKTWAVFDWLTSCLERGDPGWLVLPLSASAESVGERETVEDLVPRLLHRWLGNGTFEVWKRRMMRWFDHRGPSFPRILLIVDGLNERPDTRWANTLLPLLRKEWLGRVAALISDRPNHWSDRCAAALGGAFRLLPIRGYELDELSVAMSSHGRNVSLLPDTLYDLIALPRYCGLVCEHFDELLSTDDFTRARVIYLDLRHRTATRLGYPLTEIQLKDFVVEAAEAHMRAREGLPVRELAALIPLSASHEAALVELQTSGFLQAVEGRSGRYRVESNRLAYGMGLLVAEELSRQDKGGASRKTLDETIASWFEPEPDADLKVEAAAAAVFHAMLNTVAYPASARRALLLHWIRLRNSGGRAQASVSGYARRVPEDFIAVAENLWAAGGGFGAGQDLIARSLAAFRGEECVDKELIRAVPYWLGLVHRAGHPIDRSIEDSNPLPVPDPEVDRRLSLVSVPGSATVCLRVMLTPTMNDGFLQLRRLGILLAFGRPRTHATAFLAWAVSSAVMGFPSESTEIAWALRLADDEPAELLLEWARRLTTGNVVEVEAARRLLRALGTREAREIVTTIPDKGDQDWEESLERHREDPCAGSFLLSLTECAVCANRVDFSVRHAVHRCKFWLESPEAILPPGLLDAAEAELFHIDPAKYLLQLTFTHDDRIREDLELVLAARKPELVARFWSAVAASLVQRSVEQAGFTAHGLESASLLLSADDLGSMLETIHRSDVAFPTREASGRFGSGAVNTATMVSATLPLLSPDERAELILSRGDGTFTLLRFEEWAEPLGEAVRSMVVAALDNPETSSERLVRCMMLLVPDLKLHISFNARFLSLMHHPDKVVRGVAMRCIALAGDKPTRVEAALGSQPNIASDPREWEAVYGSELVATYGKALPILDLAQRLHPAALTHAIYRQKRGALEVSTAANLLHRSWCKVSEAPLTPPPPPLAINRPDDSAGMAFPSFEPEDRSVRIVAQTATWRDRPGPSSPASDTSAAWLERHEARIQALLDGWGSAAFNWYGRGFSFRGLEMVVRERPELASRWVSALTDPVTGTDKWHRLTTFYSALCGAMLVAKHQDALSLWRALEDHRRAGRDAGVIWCVFAASDGDDVKAARDEVLKACRTDADLFEVAVEAGRWGRLDWLSQKAEAFVTSLPLWQRATGLALAAYSDLPLERFEDLVRLSRTQGTWMEDCLQRFRSRARANVDARAWFERFRSAGDRVEAWGAFRMLLATADERMDVLGHDFSLAFSEPWKSSYVAIMRERMREAMKKRSPENDKLFDQGLRTEELIPFER